ncbi:hypothetical protein H2248_007153 [Termitomyces sp. 'cryptogamus']|nr:hypothetical protein H2248_007153 [Termitomyces sp. 'cryptogamus']
MESSSEVFSLLHSIGVHSYINTASFMVLVYDYMLCALLEIKFIWAASWTLPKLLYLLTRYIPFFTFGTLLYFDHNPSSDDACRQSDKFAAWSINISMCTAGLIFVIRTWAVWNRDRKVGLLLSVLTISDGISGFIVLNIWAKDLKAPSVPIKWKIYQCFNVTESHLTSVSFGLILPLYAVSLLLLLVRAYMHLKDGTSESKFICLVHIQGIIYYIYLFCFSLLNMVFNLVLPPIYLNLLSKMQQVVSSTLACRMLLELRASSPDQAANAFESSLSRLDFMQTVEPDGVEAY